MCTRTLTATAVILMATGVNAFADEFAKLSDTSTLPQGTIKISETVPSMDEHWSRPEDLPLGPIYCVHKGKIVCIEYMMSQADLQAGKSWPELVGLKNLPLINHVNMGFMPTGHHGYEIPHYDLHIYFVSPEALKTITPTQ
jgi:hypothetical protein